MIVINNQFNNNLEDLLSVNKKTSLWESIKHLFKIIGLLHSATPNLSPSTLLRFYSLCDTVESSVLKWAVRHTIRRAISSILSSYRANKDEAKIHNLISMAETAIPGSTQDKENRCFRNDFKNALFASPRHFAWDSTQLTISKVISLINRELEKASNLSKRKYLFAIKEKYIKKKELAEKGEVVFLPKWYHATKMAKTLLFNQSIPVEVGVYKGAWVSSIAEKEYGNEVLVLSSCIENPILPDTGRIFYSPAKIWHGFLKPITLESENLVEVAVPEKDLDKKRKELESFNCNVISNQELEIEAQILSKVRNCFYPSIWQQTILYPKM